MASKINKKKDKETPLMKQYGQIKAKYPGALLLFRVGDFYETFGEDAVKAAGILGIVLTKRANGQASHIELAGFPHHSLDSYLPKLVRAGQRVAICDQLEDPKTTKTIVKRGVTELVTPGVAYNDKVLEVKHNNYLASVCIDKKSIGVSFLDISTGEFMVAQGGMEYVDKLLQGLKPAEVILCKGQAKQFEEYFGNRFYTYNLEDWVYGQDFANERLLKHFDTKSLKGFGVDDMHEAIIAAGASIHYLEETHHNDIKHLNHLSRIEEDRYVWLDRFTIRNLELLTPSNPDGKALIDILDKTKTPMGARLLRRWLVLPLKELAPIQERLETVDYLFNNWELSKQLDETLTPINDLERVVSKVALNRINPREVLQLSKALKQVALVKQQCEEVDSPYLNKIADQLNDCKILVDKIDASLKEDAPMLLNKGGVIADGVNTELDELRKIAFSGKDYLVDLKTRESERTGIPSLKIAFNNVFGYYLEVTNAHKDKVPSEWIRKQTLVNAERYITEELKEYEQKILGAEEKIVDIEARLYNELVSFMADYVIQVQQNANIIAKLDCFLSFAEIAKKHNYKKPTVTEDYELALKEVRHPVIEQQLPIDEPYIPNDIYLNNDEQQIVILTGPNMSGKSAILRQTALATIMAQIGCFVAADYAQIGLVDKVYTRVGASDNISQGESTFMVEMIETASILNNLSDRSLVLLDEIGRGTSTFDGVSLAWSIAEFLNKHKTKPKTIFATHYHELNELEAKSNGVKNYHVTIKEVDNNILFMRKMKPGGSEHSFGIHVAKMAGVPKQVLDKANDILAKLEADRSTISSRNTMKKMPKQEYQVSMFQLDDPKLMEIKEQLGKIDTNTMTPVEALMKLHEMKNLLSD